MTRAYRQSSSADPPCSNPTRTTDGSPGRADSGWTRSSSATTCCVSGLFAPKVGGPSVKPYQPEGYWAHLNFPRREYHNDHGESLYRRAMYTYWQRSFLHPSLLAFDAPSREECTANRPRSNTPLQALVLLNDPIFVEGRRHSPSGRSTKAGRTTGRGWTSPTVGQSRGRPGPRSGPSCSTCSRGIGTISGHTQRRPRKFLRIGERPAAKDVPAAELAAWTSVARAILNLHETITRN